MRDLLDVEDWDGLVVLAKEQEREGAHILDVNVDFVAATASKICTSWRLGWQQTSRFP